MTAAQAVRTRAEAWWPWTRRVIYTAAFLITTSFYVHLFDLPWTAWLSLPPLLAGVHWMATRPGGPNDLAVQLVKAACIAPGVFVLASLALVPVVTFVGWTL